MVNIYSINLFTALYDAVRRTQWIMKFTSAPSNDSHKIFTWDFSHAKQYRLTSNREIYQSINLLVPLVNIHDNFGRIQVLGNC